MTKIEIINEMYNVINNNADVFEYPHKHMTEYYADKVRTTKKAELEQWLAKLNAMVEEANEAKTVETEVENDTEYVAEPKATKKDILMGLHKNGEVKCDLATAEVLATEGFIEIEDYEDGVLYGDIYPYGIYDAMFNKYECDIMDMLEYDGWVDEVDNEVFINLVDRGYVSAAEYLGDNNWKGETDNDNILTDFCKRWDNKLNEAA